MKSSISKIAVFYPYFLPAFKAGGPIQSIANMCRHLGGSTDYSFYIICTSSDYNQTDTLPGIVEDCWNDFEEGKAAVYYLSRNARKRRNILQLLMEIGPDIIFINGIFFPLFNLVPLTYRGSKKILSVRGMMHPGALSQKRLKKFFFLRLLRFFQVHKKVVFHATDETEKQHVVDFFGKETAVYVAQNLPQLRTAAYKINSKNPNEAKLVSIALVSPMKNHALILEALQFVKANICYDIYGPIKDEEYWAKCQSLLVQLPGNVKVKYKGSLMPEKVISTLMDYHCLILPSKSENFGHAIYEALCAGRPVITSHFTPWNNLAKSRAGWNVDILDKHSVIAAIEELALQDDISYRRYTEGAAQFAAKSINIDSIKDQYRVMFS